MVFTQEQKIKIIELWFSTKSYITVRRNYCRHYHVNMSAAPRNNEIARFVKHFVSHGSVSSTHKCNSGRPSTITKDKDVIERVKNSVTISRENHAVTEHRS